MKISDECFDRLVRFVKLNYGINLERKRMLVEGRLSAPSTQAGFDSIDNYVNSILGDPDSKGLTSLINKLTTNHTFFMREPDHFEFMKREFLPYAEKTVMDNDLRIWCAACSNGAEPYSMAMIIDEYFGNKTGVWDTTILATDIDTDAMRTGVSGLYTPDMLNACPQHYIDKYFTHTEQGMYQLCDRIRREVVFKKFNLMNEIIYKKQFDLISCRNVMIYFDQREKEELVRRLYDAVKPGGFLFIGHAENISRDSKFEYISPAIFRKPPN